MTSERPKPPLQSAEKIPADVTPPSDPASDMFSRIMDAYQREHFPFGFTASFMRSQENLFTSVAIHCGEVEGGRQVTVWQVGGAPNLEVNNGTAVILREGEGGIKATYKVMREEMVVERRNSTPLDWASTLEDLADELDDDELYEEFEIDGVQLEEAFNGFSGVPLFPMWRGPAEH